jgi:Lar family restriction alleviation protein
VNEQKTDRELLPCPFCGSTNVEDQQGVTYRWRVAVCVDCGARAGEVRCHVTGSGANTKALAEARQLAFDEWNRRAAAQIGAAATGGRE